MNSSVEYVIDPVGSMKKLAELCLKVAQHDIHFNGRPDCFFISPQVKKVLKDTSKVKFNSIFGVPFDTVEAGGIWLIKSSRNWYVYITEDDFKVEG